MRNGVKGGLATTRHATTSRASPAEATVGAGIDGGATTNPS